VRHDQEKHARVARFFFFVLEADQAERRQRHYFPRRQEEERIRRGEDQRQAQEQQVEKEPKSAQVSAPFHLLQVAERIQRNSGRQCCQRHVEISRQWVKADCPGEHRIAEWKADLSGTAAEDGGRRSDQIEERTGQRCTAGHPASSDRMAPEGQTGHCARKPDKDSAQEQLCYHRADASHSTSSSIRMASARLLWK
jgi:hypothetical protein